MPNVPVYNNFSVDVKEVEPGDRVVYTAENDKLSRILSNDAWLKETAQQALSKAGEAGAAVDFIYKCTGVNDSGAIESIINDFFNTGTAMTMKLVISGEFGLSPNARQIEVASWNSRGAVCWLDFSNCDIPEITAGGDFFLHISGAGVRLNVTGLNVRGDTGGVYIYLGGQNSFNQCSFTMSGANNCGIHLKYTECNYFDECSVYYTQANAAAGVTVEDSQENVFHNCRCTIEKNVQFSEFRGWNINGGSNIMDSCRVYLDAVYNLINGYELCGISICGNNNILVNNEIAVYGDMARIGSAQAVCISSGSNLLMSGNNIDYDGTGVEISTDLEGYALINCCRIIGSGDGIKALADSSGARGARIVLRECNFNTYNGYGVNQVSAASTIRWNITGCAFAGMYIMVDGAQRDETTDEAGVFLYMPQYANLFSTAF